jgi:hypothetical protein
MANIWVLTKRALPYTIIKHLTFRNNLSEKNFMAVPSCRAAAFAPEPIAPGSRCPVPVQKQTAQSGSGPLGFASRSATASHYPPILRAEGARYGNSLGAGSRAGENFGMGDGLTITTAPAGGTLPRYGTVPPRVRGGHAHRGQEVELVRCGGRTSSLAVGGPSEKGRKFHEVGYGTCENGALSVSDGPKEVLSRETLRRIVACPVKGADADLALGEIKGVDI